MVCTAFAELLAVLDGAVRAGKRLSCAFFSPGLLGFLWLAPLGGFFSSCFLDKGPFPASLFPLSFLVLFVPLLSSPLTVLVLPLLQILSPPSVSPWATTISLTLTTSDEPRAVDLADAAETSAPSSESTA